MSEQGEEQCVSSHPASSTEIFRLEPVDLTPMTFNSIKWLGRCLVIDPPLTLEPTLDEESGQLLILKDDELGIDVFASTREEVASELAEQMLFLWDIYALENPDRLTAGARGLHDAYKRRLAELGEIHL